MILDSTLLKKFLKLAGSELKGKWILVGGTLLPAVGIDLRPTIDIDLVGLTKHEAEQNLELMQLAEKIGLSIESVNQAASFFLHQTKYKESDLLPLHQGNFATIFRPSFALYLRLKLGRLSPTDVMDCRAYFQYCLKNDKIDFAEVKSIFASALKKDLEREKKSRLQELQNEVLKAVR